MCATHLEPHTFQPLPAGPDCTVTWIHLGDLHMTEAGEQNEIDLGRIVDCINQVYAKHGVSFVYLPGDIADDGSTTAYAAVRSHLDRLQLPWCGIVGDHDVHERSFANFRQFIAENLTGAFTVGRYRFLRLNAFSEPRPDAFIVSNDQLCWIEDELKAVQQRNERAVLLLHCYPSDLKQGGDALATLLQRYPVLLVDMGHTHYNELSNDGKVLYSATRSTGQIEEGPVGFSVITLDGDTVSWHFVEPGKPDLIAITAPADRRLEVSQDGSTSTEGTEVHAKVWSREHVERVTATFAGTSVALTSSYQVLWTGTLPLHREATGSITVEATTTSGTQFSSSIEVASGDSAERKFAAVDQDNAIGAWEERGILGTQLGPNKNGRKW